MSLNPKIQALAELLNHDPEDLKLWLAEYPGISNRAAVQLLLMAIRYRLDPLCDEISLMETTSGLNPFITIDGWVKLINSHAQFAGMSLREPSELVNELPTWIECTIYRHDRILPIVVREYMEEVKTEHGSWVQMPRRMLRHRAIQQCARLAFGIGSSDMMPDRIRLPGPPHQDEKFGLPPDISGKDGYNQGTRQLKTKLRG